MAAKLCCCTERLKVLRHNDSTCAPASLHAIISEETMSVSYCDCAWVEPIQATIFFIAAGGSILNRVLMVRRCVRA
jgi:hypothetical protein